jgi:hypothetical protein
MEIKPEQAAAAFEKYAGASETLDKVAEYIKEQVERELTPPYESEFSKLYSKLDVVEEKVNILTLLFERLIDALSGQQTNEEEV